MLMLNKVTVAAVLTVTATAIAVIPALADPITNSGKPVIPKATDIVGFGSDVTQNVFDQFSIDYNNSVGASAPHLYSWDSANPRSGAIHDLVTAKSGCARAPRPAGSSEAILRTAGGRYALTANTLTRNKKAFCTDFARSSRGRAAGDPPARRGGIQFVAFALDGVTWATNEISNAPSNLTTHELFDIYTCMSTNWDQVGGKTGTINAQLPPTGSSTRTFFLNAIGVIAPGPCVDSIKGESPDHQPDENEGINRYLRGANTIYPYSIGKYIAQRYHSARCLNSQCTPVEGVVCRPRTGLNRFGCDTRGTMVLRTINGSRPTVPFPLPKSCPARPLKEPDCAALNPVFAGGVCVGIDCRRRAGDRPAFIRFVYEVVRWTKGTPGNIPKYLERLFGPRGWVCVSRAAHFDLADYGFLRLGITSCGAAPASPNAWGPAHQVPGLNSANTGGNAAITSVSCASPGNCGAGGYYTHGSSRQAFVVTQHNGTWGSFHTVAASLNTGGNAEVTSVSCASPGNCSAGGLYTKVSGNTRPFVVSQKHGTWQPAQTVIFMPSVGDLAGINSVSCASPGNCSAGGSFRNSQGRFRPFVVSQKNGTWEKAIQVPGSLFNVGIFADTISVSCRSAGNCSAGGDYNSKVATKESQPWVDSQKNGTWHTAIEVPGMTALNTGGRAATVSVSCGSAGNCSAGGSYLGTSGERAWVVSQKNGTWKPAITVPGSLNRGAAITSVSCASAGNCGAGGSYFEFGKFQGFVVTQHNGTWGTIQNVPILMTLNTGGMAAINSVSCASAGNCSAGGYYKHGPGLQAFVVSETGGVWGPATPVPGLANAGGNAQVTSVSCATAGHCGAGGYYADILGNPGHLQAFVDSET